MAALIPSASATGSGTMTLAGPSTNSNQTVTIPDATGTMMVSGNMPAFSAYLSSNQTPSASTWTKVTLDTENFDTNNNFASSRFTPTVAGYYQINAQVGNDYGGSYNAGTMGGAIYKNGSVYAWQRSTSDTAGYAYGVNIVSSVVYLNGSTDYVELYGFNPNASPVFLGGLNQTSMSGVLVRAA
jgi:hypothetical protein